MVFCKLGQFPRGLYQQVMQAGRLSVEPYLTISPRQLQVLQPQKYEGEAPDVTCPRGFCQEERAEGRSWGEGKLSLLNKLSLEAQSSQPWSGRQELLSPF